MGKSKQERKKSKVTNKILKKAKTPNALAEIKEHLAIEQEKAGLRARIASFPRTNSEYDDSPRKTFVEHVEVNEAEALKKVDEAMVFDYIKKRTNGFTYEYILTEDLSFIKAKGKQMPNLMGYPANVVVEGEDVLLKLNDKLSHLNSRMRNVTKTQMQPEELSEILKLGNKEFSELELKILKRAAVNELGTEKASELLGEDTVSQILEEQESAKSDQSK